MTTAIDQTIEEAGLKTAVVQTPIDFTPNLPQLNESCAPADFQTGNCAPGTVIGTAVATSPLLTQPLTGTVFLITNPVSLPDIGLDLQGELALKLMGTLAPGNIVTFDGLPDIPIAHFELRFSGAPDGLLQAAKDLCQPPAPNFTGNFTAHSGTSLPFASAATIEGCGGGTAGANAGTKCVKKKFKRKKKGPKSDAAAAKKKKKRKACGEEAQEERSAEPPLEPLARGEEQPARGDEHRADGPEEDRAATGRSGDQHEAADHEQRQADRDRHADAVIRPEARAPMVAESTLGGPNLSPVRREPRHFPAAGAALAMSPS